MDPCQIPQDPCSPDWCGGATGVPALCNTKTGLLHTGACRPAIFYRYFLPVIRFIVPLCQAVRNGLPQ